MPPTSSLTDDISACCLCTDLFAATATRHAPRPVVWFRPEARLLISGQAPGMRVHLSGLPFDDASGDRLRDWMGLDRAAFYDRDRVAVVPMGFCFPGYDAKGADLKPPPLCARTWRQRALDSLPGLRLRLLVGGLACDWHLGRRPLSDHVADWRRHAESGIFPLPHPSWRNTGWLKRHPWFQDDLVPELRRRVAEVLA